MIDDALLDALVTSAIAGVVTLSIVLPFIVMPYLATRRRLR